VVVTAPPAPVAPVAVRAGVMDEVLLLEVEIIGRPGLIVGVGLMQSTQLLHWLKFIAMGEK
jgi:hypothetical protein